MGTIEKVGLADVILKIKNKETFPHQHAGAKKVDDLSLMTQFQINRIGQIPVPVSLQDFEMLKTISEESSFGHGLNMIIDSSLKLARTISTSQVPENALDAVVSSLIPMALGLLNLPPDASSIQANLDEVLLFEPRGHLEFHCTAEKQPGMFASMMLQIPVEGGHNGGRTSLERDGLFFEINSDLDSSVAFYLTAYLADCRQKMEPVIEGRRLVMVFNLLWMDGLAVADSPRDFPTFIHALDKVKRSLQPWVVSDRLPLALTEASMMATPVPYYPMKENRSSSVENCNIPYLSSAKDMLKDIGEIYNISKPPELQKENPLISISPGSTPLDLTHQVTNVQTCLDLGAFGSQSDSVEGDLSFIVSLPEENNTVPMENNCVENSLKNPEEARELPENSTEQIASEEVGLEEVQNSSPSCDIGDSGFRQNARQLLFSLDQAQVRLQDLASDILGPVDNKHFLQDSHLMQPLIVESDIHVQETSDPLGNSVTRDSVNLESLVRQKNFTSGNSKSCDGMIQADPEQTLALPTSNCPVFECVEENEELANEAELSQRLPASQAECEGDVLVVLLDHRYCKTDLSLVNLKGRDRLLAHVFRSLGFVDVHLAVITQHVTGNLDDCFHWDTMEDCGCVKRNYKIGRRPALLKDVQLDLRSQLVGDVRSLLYPSFGPNSVTEELGGVCPESWYHHAALVITPRSVRTRCRYGFNALLDLMESLLPSMTLGLLDELRQVLDFCRAEPFRVWKDQGTKPGERALRLMRLCLQLKARDEGLELLELLGTDYPLDPHVKALDPRWEKSPLTFFYEGIRNDRVAQTIAEFQCRVSGWTLCCDAILRLISPTRLFMQLVHYTALCLHLLDRFCSEGASSVADRISLLLTGLNQQETYKLNQSHVDTFVDLVLTLETNPKTSSSERVSCLVEFFRRLDSLHQCRLLLRLAKSEVYPRLCSTLLECHLHSSYPLEEILLPLLTGYFHLGNHDVLQWLTDEICLHPEPLLDLVLSSSEVWEAASSSVACGRAVMTRLMESRIGQLKKVSGKLDETILVLNQAGVLATEEGSFRADLSGCLLLILRSQRNSALSDVQLLTSFWSLCSQLSTERLLHLVLDIHRTHGSRMKKHPSSLDIFSHLCRMLSNRDLRSTGNLPTLMYIQAIECFIWLGEESTLAALVKKICLACFAGDIWEAEKNATLEAIIESLPSVLQGTDKGGMIRDTFSALMEAWIGGLCRFPGLSDTSIRSKMLECVQLAVRTARNIPPSVRSCRPSLATIFSALFAKLSVKKLGRLIWDVYEWCGQERPSLKKFPDCLDVYRQLCRNLVQHIDLIHHLAMTSLSDLMVDVMKCLLWLGDESILLCFSQKICTSCSTTDNSLAMKIVSSADIRQMIIAWPLGRAAFCLLLDQRIASLAAVKEPIFTWQQPKASVPGHPKVEAFLRSSRQTMNYANFPNVQLASMFARVLEKNGLQNGYSVRAEAVLDGKIAVCNINKTRHLHQSEMELNERLRTEMTGLLLFRQNLQQLTDEQQSSDFGKRPTPRDLETSSGDSDELSVLPAVKRAKPNATVIDLTS